MQFLKGDSYIHTQKSIQRSFKTSPYFFINKVIEKQNSSRIKKREKKNIINKEIWFGEINMMTLANSMLYFQTCIYSEPFFHDMHDNHI